MSRKIDEFTARRITVETSVSVETVLERLNKELSKAQSGGEAVIPALQSSTTKEDFADKLKQFNGGKDFVLFSALEHSIWLAKFTGAPVPKTSLYTFGNPLVAQTMLTHNLYAALHVPPRLLVQEKVDHRGTLIFYIEPSSLIAVPVDGIVNEELKKAAQALDAKIEGLVSRITAV